MNHLFDFLVNIDFAAFNFEHPKWLWLLLLLAAFIAMEYFPQRRNMDNRRILKKFIDKHLIKYLTKPANTKANLRKTIYFCVCYALIIISAANPRWDYRQEEVFKPNLNVVLLLDVSKSMNAEDEKPSRLERAKQEIEDLINSSSGVSFGLIAFADNSHIIAPITDDKNAFKYFLSAIDESLFNERASRVDKGVAAAVNMLKSYKDGSNYIIVLSDGGFEVKDTYTNITGSLNDAKLIGMGFGSDLGAPIPDGRGSWIKDESGKMVTSKLDREEFLKLVNSDDYVKSTYLDDDTKKVLNIISATSSKTLSKTKSDRVWNDRFYIPLVLAMLMFLFKFRKGLAFPLVILCLWPHSSFAADAKPVQETSGFSWQRIKKEIGETFNFKKYFLSPDEIAEDNYNSKNYAQAADGFKSDYNKGVAKYRTGNLKDAESYFEKDKTNADNEYNIGNSRIFSGEIEKSIESYEAALKIAPDHEKAKHNLEIAKKLLEQKKKKEEEQKKQQEEQDKKDNKQNKKDKNKGKDGDKSGKNQNEQGDKGEGNQQQQPGSQGQDPNLKEDKGGQPNEQTNGEQNKGDADKTPDDKKGEDKKNGGKQPEDSNNNSGDKEQNGNNLSGGTDNKNKARPQSKTSLDINAEEMMNRLKNDPSELLKRRFRMDKNSNEEGVSNGGNRPW